MKELDTVNLLKDFQGIPAGTEGVIVLEYGGKAFEVEFFDSSDNTIDVKTIPKEYLKICETP